MFAYFETRSQWAWVAGALSATFFAFELRPAAAILAGGFGLALFAARDIFGVRLPARRTGHRHRCGARDGGRRAEATGDRVEPASMPRTGRPPGTRSAPALRDLTRQ